MRLLTLLAFCLLAAPVAAQDVIKVERFARSAGVLPIDRMMLRNASGYDLTIWMAVNAAAWKPYDVPAEHSVTIRAGLATLAISTAEDDNDTAAYATPSRAAADVSDTGGFQKPYYYTTLKGGTRAIICWSASQDIWRIQKFGENVCN